MVSGRSGCYPEQIGQLHPFVSIDFPRGRRRSYSIGPSKLDNHEIIRVNTKVWTKDESPYPETHHRCCSCFASRMVCRKVSGENGIPDPAGTASHTSESNGGSSKLRELISISSEGSKEKREEGHQAVLEGEESEEVF